MDEKNNEVISSQNQEKAEILENARKILQEIPGNELIAIINERIQHLPNEETREIVQTVIQARLFSGPIPPPEMLIEYASVSPEFPDRIIAMAESQQQHRQSMESGALNAATNIEKKGQNYAFIISLSMIAAALYLIANGKEIYGTILAGGTLVSLASVFITGRKKKKSSTEAD